MSTNRRTPIIPTPSRSSEKSEAAVGFRAHSGWSTVVVLGGSTRSPAVVDRRRIEIANPKVEGSKQPYHSAEYLSRSKAEAFVKKCIQETKRLTESAIREILERTDGSGFRIVRSGIVLGSLPSTPDLAAAFASHAMAHAAEGEMFRNAITNACKARGLQIGGLRERELFTRGAPDLGLPVAQLQNRLTELGEAVGPPWRQDEKHAALVAWLALAGKF